MPNTYFFDFDDTLYSHKTRCVPESTKRCLKSLMERGERVIIATGRGAEAAEMICRETGIKPATMIVMNGQIVLEDGQVVFENHITLPSMNSIITTAQQENHACGGYYVRGMLVDCANERVQKVWQDFAAPMPDVIPDFAGNHALYQGNLYITREEADIYGDHLPDYVLNWSHQYLLNLIPKNAGKSQAMYWCFEQYGIERMDAFAFGDGFNDADMLRAVGHSVAMGNATPELKGLAEYVTSTVDEDGILKALEYYRGIGSI